jgi:hypothetical protein
VPVAAPAENFPARPRVNQRANLRPNEDCDPILIVPRKLKKNKDVAGKRWSYLKRKYVNPEKPEKVST